MPANDETIVLPHGVHPYWARGPAAHFGSITFSWHDFWPRNGQNPSWGREPYGSVSAILGGCSVWFVIFGGDVSGGPKNECEFFYQCEFF